MCLGCNLYGNRLCRTTDIEEIAILKQFQINKNSNLGGKQTYTRLNMLENEIENPLSTVQNPFRGLKPPTNRSKCDIVKLTLEKLHGSSMKKGKRVDKVAH